MNRPERVAEQHRMGRGRTPRGPALVPDERELPPYRFVRRESVSAQVRGKYALAVGLRLGVAHAVQSRLSPGRLAALDDKGAHRRRMPIVVCDEIAVLAAAEREREAVERLRGTVPRE